MLSKIDWNKIPTVSYIYGHEEYSAMGIANSMLPNEAHVLCVVRFKGKAPRYSETTVGSVKVSVARAWLKLENELCK